MEATGRQARFVALGVFGPGGAKGPASFVDFIVALDYLSPNGRLAGMFQKAMAPYGLSVLITNKYNVEKVLSEVRRGWIKPFVHLDLSSRPGDPFELLREEAARQGVYTVRRPQDDPWVLKADSHPLLAAAGLPLPPTVFFKASDPDREFTAAERAALGERVVIKPSFGEASKGVVVGVEPTLENLRAARDYNRKDDWLFQKMIKWGTLNGRPAYLRGYNVFGYRSLLWWQKGDTDNYDLVTWNQLHEYNLLPVIELMDRITELTKVDFFSTEIAITADSGPDRFCLIDYVNDQCDMDPDGNPPSSPPAVWCQWVCERFAEFTWRRKNGLPEGDHNMLHLYPPMNGQVQK